MRLSPGLEEIILYAAITGNTELKTIKKDELSKTGQFIYHGLLKLAKSSKPPYSAKSVFIAATDVAGGDPEVVRPYLHQILDSGSGVEAENLLSDVRNKQALMNVVNIASTQMSKGEFNPEEFMTLLRSAGVKLESENFQAVSNYFDGKKKYVMPEGIPLLDLPRIHAATHGLYGYWALAGDSGVGKSTLALQIAVLAQKEWPVIYYDYEQGINVLLAHLSKVFNYDNAQIRKATNQLYFRTNLHTLDQDLRTTGKPTLIVVDSIQKVSVRGDDRRAGIEKWIHRLEEVKLSGHRVLIISEKNRAFYGRTGQAGYKESGEIEYSVDVGMELLEPKDSGGMVEVHLNKNRNWPTKGYIVTLARTHDWWFEEVGHAKKKFNDERGKRKKKS